MRVVVVGNAPYDDESPKLGAWVDSCDTVIRCNNYQIVGHEPYVGSKTDIWVIVQNPWCVVQPRQTETFQEIWRVCNRWPPVCPEHFNEVIGQTPVTTISKESLKPIMAAINGCLPSTGCVAVYLAIRRWKQIYAYNFNHFSSQQLHYYTDGELENVHHNGDVERLYFKSLRNSGKVLTPPLSYEIP